jgi:hypothetical protein
LVQKTNRNLSKKNIQNLKLKHNIKKINYIIKHPLESVRFFVGLTRIEAAGVNDGTGGADDEVTLLPGGPVFLLDEAASTGTSALAPPVGTLTTTSPRVGD